MKPLRLSIKRLLHVALVFGKYRLDRLITLGPDVSFTTKMGLLPLALKKHPIRVSGSILNWPSLNSGLLLSSLVSCSLLAETFCQLTLLTS